MKEPPGNGFDEITSVGIDVGTTTTHLVISKLKFSNASLQNRAPHLAISERRIIFQSDIYMTPLNDAGEIDENAAADLIAAAYQKADINPAQITTGALIVTGQSAAKTNALSASSKLAALAGDFVVECAGPHLESFLAARGSQAVDYSRTTGKTVLNIDIGGGTSNYALIINGKVVSTACLSMGGRFITIHRENSTDNPQNITVQKLSHSAVEYFKLNSHLAFSAGEDVVVEARLKNLTDAMAEEILQGSHPQLMLTAPLEIQTLVDDLQRQRIEIWFSGGVAALMDEQAGQANASDTSHSARYDDIGPELAMSLRALCDKRGLLWRTAPQAIRATVIGAGMHSVQLSGSTIGFEETSLPLRNLRLVPVIMTADLKEDYVGAFETLFRKELQLRQIDWHSTPLAIVIGGLDKQNLSFKFLKELSQCVARVFIELKGHQPLVVISDTDLAMSFKQLLSPHLAGSSIITIDGIDASAGDYIDIGKPVISSADQSTRSLSVVVKTLVFYKSAV